MKDFFAERRPHRGLEFDEYVELLRREVADRKVEQPVVSGRTSRDAGRLNLQRMERLIRSFRPLTETRMIAARVRIPQLWMVLSEISCGDSAQNIPVIAAIAAENPLIDLRIILRDANPDIMDRYLTNGARSIPKLVAFTEDGQEIFQWGPRPEAARVIFAEGIAAGVPKEKVIERIHLFYGKDRGRSVEAEIAALLAHD